MQIYKVGGAVRDELLGLKVVEIDWVVVGATPKQMLELGYQQVGKNFPVFLHPETKEEYALARTEKKIASGHTGFSIDANPNVTLEEDLSRRDLTINAIARDAGGRLIDPYGGIDDLNQGLLKHVSHAFVEDPLRVLRVARFHAKLHHLNFTIADETFEIMKAISGSGELETLPGERIWREFEKGLTEQSPHKFIETLYRCNALEVLIPSLDRRWHHADNMREVIEKIGERTLAGLSYAAKTNASGVVRWAICCHGLAQDLQPKNIASQKVHDAKNVGLEVERICKKMHTPNEHARIATLSAKYIMLIMQAKTARPDAIVQLLDACDAWRKPEQFGLLLQVAESLLATHSDQAKNGAASITFLRQSLSACQKINAREFVNNGLQGEAVGAAIANARKIIVADLKKQFNH
ncbi:multifunctional CCA addition/repair protein [Pseudomonadales bacterium]|nr:multifunctional CCA addition/repair protein [Pseudomonadales bacterium]MDB4090479.1 multifunctional CCA addition/repair protein [Pseudomonadales bacterium]MDB4430762.1 multifunctional CCA addition/repair protein [Pseudomonadales bacterium]MDB4806783.1 multifunctional CCA addition/repair protein [Pseudomonadales bacterium]MDC6464948.1 multifunctional CCA addition/repair protein [bacterium]